MIAAAGRKPRVLAYAERTSSLQSRGAPRRAALARIAALLTLLAIALLFGVSAMLLYHLGYTYESPGGSILEKMHPGSLAAISAAIALAASKPRPFLYVAHSLARRPGLVGFLFILSALLAYLILAQKSPFTALIDTFLLPIIAIILIDEQRDTVAFPVEMFLHVFLCLNALLGLFEVVSGWRLVPYVANGVEITSDWRATAIMGHPLANACVTGCYLLALLLRGGPHLVGLWRAAAILLAAAGMVAFGGRAAMVLLLLFAAPLAFLRTTTGLAFGRATPLQAAMFVLALLIAPIALIGLADFGAFDQFINRFVDDQGSAKSRVAMFELFDDLPWRDILLGPDPNLIDTLKQIEGLEFGIESFWVASTLAYGLLMALLLFFGLFLYCCEVVRASRPAAWVLLAYFFAVASTSVSLSAKTCILGLTAIMALSLLPRPTSPAAQRLEKAR